MNQALVSVIIPNYNHAPYLKQRIESVLAQTYQNFELILLDDESKDKSQKIIQAYANHPQVRHTVLNQGNSGSAFCQWDRGMELAIGKYIWIAESDDWADPEFLSNLVPMAEAHEDVGVVYSKSRIVDKKGNPLGDTGGWTDDLDLQRWQSDYINEGYDEIKRYLIKKNTIPSASAVLFRRSVLEKTRPIDIQFQLCGDWMFWIKMLGQSKVAYCSKILNFWREDTSNARMASPGTLEWIEGEQVLRTAANMVGLDAAQTTEILFNFLKKCWQWQRGYIDRMHQ